MRPLIPATLATISRRVDDLADITEGTVIAIVGKCFRHGSTKRTITRFIAAIIIAVSIEALLTIFKFALNGGGEHIIEAVWIIIAAALLLLSPGVYVYSGSKAEGMLLKYNGNTRKRREKGAELINSRN